MISPELLRRYPFFSDLTETQLRAIAMLASEANFSKGATIFEECDPANRLLFLCEGNVDLYYRIHDQFSTSTVKEFHVGEINPGDAFGTSSIIKPYELNATARCRGECVLIELDAPELRKLMTQDLDLANKLLLAVIKNLKGQIEAMRVQLAVANSEDHP